MLWLQDRGVDSSYLGLFKILTSVLNLRVGQASSLSSGSPNGGEAAEVLPADWGHNPGDARQSRYRRPFRELVRLIRIWPEVVGETIARRTEVSSLKFHTAVVRVSTAMWIQELNLMRPQILSRVNAAMRNDAVREIRFV
jgi:predicted nucleic acid-binding Zn ribbon protein